MKKVSIVTVTYDKDIEFLKYNLKSVDKFCNSYHNNKVIIDDHDNDCEQCREYMESIGQQYIVNTQAKHIRVGYVRQQFMGYYMDQYFDDGTEYICCVDTDNIFTAPHSPDVHFIDGLPIQGKARWEDLPERGRFWIESTTNILKFRPDHEFMRRMPFVYPVWLFKEVREYLEDVHNDTLVNIFKDIPVSAEYNIWGGYAYRYHRDKFYWIDEYDDMKLWRDLGEKIPCTQYSNRAEAQPHRYVDLSKPGNVISSLFEK